MAADKSTGDPRVKIGISGLDVILGGGLPANRLYLIQGDPGVGKTTLAMRFLLQGASEGEKVLYITLSETAEELHTVAGSHGWSLDKVSLFELTAAQQSLGTSEQNTLFHPAEIELTETTEALLAEVEKVNPTRVVFDSLSELRLLAQSQLRYHRQILALKQYFAGRRCTVLLLNDRTTEAGDLQVQSLAHGVIRLDQLAPEYGSDRRRLRVVKLRGVKFSGGYHDYEVLQGGLEVYPRLIAANHFQLNETLNRPSGIAALDALLGGGLRSGTSTLLIGPAGCGKTTLAMQWVTEAARRGEHSAMYLFDERIDTLIERSIGMKMDMRSAIDSGKVTVKQVDPAELSPGGFGHLVRQSVERDHAKVVVIDSLNGYLNAMPEERFLVIQMHELLTYLGQKGVLTFLLVAQHGTMGPMSSPIDVSYLSDTAMLLRFFEARGEIRQAISVIKKRTGGHERTIREYKLTGSGVQVGEPLVEFHGVLTGVPTFVGQQGALMEPKLPKDAPKGIP